MEEAHRHPFAPLLGWKKLVSILNEPKHQRVAATFLTEDRALTAFYLRMDEHGRTKPRVEVVRDLKETVRKQGLCPISWAAFTNCRERWRRWWRTAW